MKKKQKKIRYIALALYVCISTFTGCATHTLWTKAGVTTLIPLPNTIKVKYKENESIIVEYAILKHHQYFPTLKDKMIHIVKKLDNEYIKKNIHHGKYQLEYNCLKYIDTNMPIAKEGFLPLYLLDPAGYTVYPSELCVILVSGHSNKQPYIYIPISHDSKYGVYKKILLPEINNREELYAWRIPFRLLLSPVTIIVDVITLPVQIVYAIYVSCALHGVR